MNASRIIAVGEEPPPLAPKPAPPDVTRNGKPSKAKGKTGERFADLNGFIDFTMAGLSRAEIAVWLILYRDTKDGTAQTGYDDLARRAGIDRRNVGRALRRLEKLDIVQVVHRGGLGRGPSRYRVRPAGIDA